MDHVRDSVIGPGAAKQAPSERAQHLTEPERSSTEQVLRDLEESCGRVERLVEEVCRLHAQPDAEQTAPIDSPALLDNALSKLEAGARGLSDLISMGERPESSTSGDSDEADGNPDLGGSTANLPISSILELLSANRKSGTLHMTSGVETFTLEILEGDVVHASSNQYAQEQLLGSILVARDQIGVEQLEEFYKRYTRRSNATDETLERESLVSREDLVSALEEQVQELFNRLYAAGSGTFDFYVGGSSNIEQRIRMNVTRLLLESARTKDEQERQSQFGPAEEAGTV